MGRRMSTKTTWVEMLNGMPPTVCLQVLDSSPLLAKIVVKWRGVGGVEEFLQTIEYTDIMHKCDHCAKAGHTHWTCTNEQSLDPQGQANRSWADRVAGGETKIGSPKPKNTQAALKKVFTTLYPRMEY